MSCEHVERGYAPVKKSVIISSLAVIFLLAIIVCILQFDNAVSLRGTAKLSEYVQKDGREEKLIPIIETPWVERDVLHIRGALMRMDQPVSSVNMRVGVILETGESALEEAILLNTQLIRRFDVAAQYGCDDHCGFSAAVQMKRLPEAEASYRVVLIDETDRAKRMIDTQMKIILSREDMAYTCAGRTEKEEQHAQ